MLKKPPTNAGNIRDVGLIPGLGRSLVEGHGNPLCILVWRIPIDRSLAGCIESIGLQRVGHD